jgi:hypothetical protein
MPSVTDSRPFSAALSSAQLASTCSAVRAAEGIDDSGREP